MDSVLVKIHSVLGIKPEHLKSNRLAFHQEAQLEQLTVVDIDFEGRPFILEASAAKSWAKMKCAANADGVALLPFSGFRSYLRQKRLIDWQLRKGRTIDSILTQIAIPGFSEHHSGRAVDLHSVERPVLEEEFEKSAAFHWLSAHAGQFNFSLSYPKANPHGIIYEPWHWLYEGI